MFASQIRLMTPADPTACRLFGAAGAKVSRGVTQIGLDGSLSIERGADRRDAADDEALLLARRRAGAARSSSPSNGAAFSGTGAVTVAARRARSGAGPGDAGDRVDVVEHARRLVRRRRRRLPGDGDRGFIPASAASARDAPDRARPAAALRRARTALAGLAFVDTPRTVYSRVSTAVPPARPARAGAPRGRRRRPACRRLGVLGLRRGFVTVLRLEHRRRELFDERHVVAGARARLRRLGFRRLGIERRRDGDLRDDVLRLEQIAVGRRDHAGRQRDGVDLEVIDRDTAPVPVGALRRHRHLQVDGVAEPPRRDGLRRLGRQVQRRQRRAFLAARQRAAPTPRRRALLDSVESVQSVARQSVQSVATGYIATDLRCARFR